MPINPVIENYVTPSLDKPFLRKIKLGGVESVTLLNNRIGVTNQEKRF